MWNPQIYWPKAELLRSTVYPRHPSLSPDISPVRSEGSPKFTGQEKSACRAPLSTSYGSQRRESLRDPGNLEATFSVIPERPATPRSQGDRNLPTPGIARVPGTVYELESLRGQDLAWTGQASGVWRGVRGPRSPQVGILEGDTKKKAASAFLPLPRRLQGDHGDFPGQTVPQARAGAFSHDCMARLHPRLPRACHPSGGD